MNKRKKMEERKSMVKTKKDLQSEFESSSKQTQQKLSEYLECMSQRELVQLKLIYTEALEQNETLDWARGKASVYISRLDEIGQEDPEVQELTNLLRELTARKQQERSDAATTD